MIRVTITRPGTTNSYGQLMTVGQIYTVEDNFGFSLIQSGQASDTDYSLVSPGVGYAIRENITYLNAATIAAPTPDILANVSATYALDVPGYTKYRSDGTSLNAITPPSLAVWKAALALQVAGTSKATIAFVGDSTTMGAYGNGSPFNGNRPNCQANLVSGLLTTALYGTSINSVFGDNNSATVAYDTRLTAGAGWSILGSPNFFIGGQRFTNSSTTNSFDFTPVDAFDTIEVWYWQFVSGGIFRISVDGGATLGANVNTQTGGTNLPVLVTRTTTLGTHVVNISRVSGSGTGILVIKTSNSAAPKIELLNIGLASLTAVNWADQTNVWGPALSIGQFAPNLSIINLTINDSFFSTSVSNYKVALQFVIDKCKASGDVILAIGNPSSNTPTQANQPAINAACRELAIANNVNLVDIYTAWGGSWAAANALGYITDPTHPNAAGYANIASMYLPYLLP